jgi:hypothetical protein
MIAERSTVAATWPRRSGQCRRHQALTLSKVISHADLLVNGGRVCEGHGGDVIRYEAIK